MVFRDHPLMSYRGVPSWPPSSNWTNSFENKRPRGEIGTLTAVSLSQIKPVNRCYLYMNHEESSYIGCLLVDDFAFCRHIAEVLRFCCNRPIAQIGSLDLAYTL
jgi:hypothetical protein